MKSPDLLMPEPVLPVLALYVPKNAWAIYKNKRAINIMLCYHGYDALYAKICIFIDEIFIY